MHKKISSIKQEYENYLRLRNLSSKTIKSYSRIIEDFIRKSSNNPSNDDVKKYLLKSIEKKESTSYIKQKYSALRILFKIIGKQSEFKLPNYKTESKIPEILNKTEISKIIKEIKNLKHRLIVQLIYSAGLRVSELTNLKPKDIDIERKIIYIRQGKGKKDRITLFPESIKNDFLKYLLQYTPKDHLFESNRNKKY